MRLRSAFFSIVLLAFANNVSADGKWVSGDTLLANCKEAIVLLNGVGDANEDPLKTGNLLNTGLCIGYIQGVLGLVQETTVVGDGAKSRICVPTDVSMRQLVRVVITKT